MLKLFPFIIMLKFGCSYVMLIYFNWDIAGLQAKGVFINWLVQWNASRLCPTLVSMKNMILSKENQSHLFLGLYTNYRRLLHRSRSSSFEVV